ncbi:hypothetical protein A5893_08115 [Pedobacter psychrophilus]|uniref:Tryptophan-rich sensory protein n=1 Tax=Pedobacter psychrophilus TaxID=1826909 RepID=A0A179DEU6_9SPHI|nr:DUF4175 family protein [Pedobacter psychrophilus]OAQ39551.1 hypothetical protein A5893_08115 [Pedobacter psychrophilus]
MDKLSQKNNQWIENERKKWRIFSLINILFLSISVGLIFGLLGNLIFSFSIVTTFITVFIATLCYLLITDKSVNVSANDFSILLNQNFPQLEDSSQLLISSETELGTLQILQANKISTFLEEIKPLKLQSKKFKIILMILFGVSLCFLLTQIFPFKKQVLASESFPKVSQISNVKDVILPQISSVKVNINAPNYTQIKQVSQSQFSLKVVENAAINWEIKTTTPAKKIEFVFNEKVFIGLKPNKDFTHWETSKILNQSGFYQVLVDGKKSELYQIEIIKDLPVVIKISQPQQQTVIDIGMPYQIKIKAVLADDYGISEAFINATTASGKGEGVSFKEQKISFQQQIGGRQLNLNKTINLKSLEMKAGDELYFYIKAKDNHGQESKSDVYIVSIADTTELMSMNGMMGGVNLVPEYFRSQRQIIIDTEKLLKEQQIITPDEFKNRSNNLGIDQKLLRLRYGKFLGEENENQIGATAEGEEHSADDGHDHGNKEEKKFGDVSAIMDQYAHKHDNAEDATFFEPEQKSKLKATLTEMWNSELRLRTYKPQEALPFEYKALRLLKDLQQSSRAYVAKTTIKTAPLKLEKRLTGELDKIITPQNQKNFDGNNKKQKDLKGSVSILEQLKQNINLAVADKKILINARTYLVDAASKQPNLYLNSLKLLGKINEGVNYSSNDISTVQKALFGLLENDVYLPKASLESGNSSLGKAYLQNLKSKQ